MALGSTRPCVSRGQVHSVSRPVGGLPGTAPARLGLDAAKASRRPILDSSMPSKLSAASPVEYGGPEAPPWSRASSGSPTARSARPLMS